MYFQIDFQKKNGSASVSDICDRKTLAKEWNRNLELERTLSSCIEFDFNYFFVLTIRGSNQFRAIMDFDGKAKPTLFQWIEFIRYVSFLEMEDYLSTPIGQSQVQILELTKDDYYESMLDFQRSIMNYLNH